MDHFLDWAVDHICFVIAMFLVGFDELARQIESSKDTIQYDDGGN